MANERFAFLPWADTESNIIAAIHPGEAAVAIDTGRWIAKRRDTGDIVPFGGSASFAQAFSVVTLNTMPNLASTATAQMRVIVEGVEETAFTVANAGVGPGMTWSPGGAGFPLVVGMKGTYIFGNGAAMSPDGQAASLTDGYATRAEIAAAAVAALNVAPTTTTKGVARFATNGEVATGALASVLVTPAGLATIASPIDYSNDQEFAAALLSAARNGMFSGVNNQNFPDGLMFTFGVVDFLDAGLTTSGYYDPIAMNGLGNFVSNATRTTSSGAMYGGSGAGWTFTTDTVTNAAASDTATKLSSQYTGDFSFAFTNSTTGTGLYQLTVIPNAEDGTFSNSAADAGFAPAGTPVAPRIVFDATAGQIKFYPSSSGSAEYTYTGALTGAFVLRRIGGRIALIKDGVGMWEFSTQLAGTARLAISKATTPSINFTTVSSRFHATQFTADFVSNNTAIWAPCSIASIALLVKGETSDPTIGTEVTASVSVDNGSSWLPVTLTGEVRGAGTNTRFCRGAVSLGGSFSNLRWKVTLGNTQVIQLQMVTLSEDY